MKGFIGTFDLGGCNFCRCPLFGSCRVTAVLRCGNNSFPVAPDGSLDAIGRFHLTLRRGNLGRPQISRCGSGKFFAFIHSNELLIFSIFQISASWWWVNDWINFYVNFSLADSTTGQQFIASVGGCPQRFGARGARIGDESGPPAVHVGQW